MFTLFPPDGTAARLFYAGGLQAVDVDTIIAEPRVAKATFCTHFPAGDDLVVSRRSVG